MAANAREGSPYVVDAGGCNVIPHSFTFLRQLNRSTVLRACQHGLRPPNDTYRKGVLQRCAADQWFLDGYLD